MILAALALTAAGQTLATGSCTAAALAPSLQAAATALDRKDLATARAAIAPAAACPADNGTAYNAHVLRADIATQEADWPTARAMLQGVGVHPEMALSARAGFIRLRADQGLGDAAAFAADRAALLAANDAGLAARGRKVESFRAGKATIDAYEAGIDQGPFHRVFEFIATPDDPAAYPASILLTDDRAAAQVNKELSLPGAGSHAWFVDLYTCSSHATLSTPMPRPGADPAYAEVKAQALRTLGDAKVVSAQQAPDRGVCFSYGWILPGLGLR